MILAARLGYAEQIEFVAYTPEEADKQSGLPVSLFAKASGDDFPERPKVELRPLTSRQTGDRRALARHRAGASRQTNPRGGDHASSVSGSACRLASNAC
jgi:hypothetical protein